uniref:Uncharacterized protein n=1 Tax=biofilter metagenome TaxID=1070537 RepID=A0A193SBM7_9ZZZZ
MTKPLTLNSRAPYERVCTACRQVRAAIEYASGRQVCTRCIASRADGVVPSGDKGVRPHYRTYDGAELRPFIARPGALSAFALPSQSFGQRVYPQDQPPTTDR